MVVLQVQTYCAQYNIRKTTTNGSTIGKEKTTPFVIRNFTRHAKPTMVYSTADTYGRIGASMYNIIKRFEGSKYGRRPNSSNEEQYIGAGVRAKTYGACGTPRRRETGL